jgi:NarL family two-component system response regulator LiaR
MVRILIVDADPTTRQVVRQLLEKRDGWEICAEVPDGEKAVSLAIHLKPDVIILNSALTKVSGLETATRISQEVSQTRVVLFAAHALSEELIQCAQNAGIRAVLARESSYLIAEVLDIVLHGGTVFERARQPI